MAEVAKVHCDVPREWLAEHRYSAESIHQTIEKLRSPACRNYVILAKNSSNAIVGLHWVQIAEKSEPLHGNVLSLWVHPQFRQRGVATRLKTSAESWLSSNGVSEVRTQVYVANTKMMALNQKLGYQVTMVGMAKKLHDGNGFNGE
ncbi:GNAT family N-acetyltransferase [Salinispirillum marinum]|uniref:GNAT family N-acetyltransferase n=2 Tax=Saccharospirillaceae TaxID=255527 RepID=A0ABV8BBA6_9GAMM